ncbi:hypothetical protein Tco_1348403, partial [Tanacetum coccineum]
MDEFKNVSGLVPSLPKSTAYFCNVLNHIKYAIPHIIPFEEGRLSVKYLGVLLVSSRLVFKDCKELIERVESRLNEWKNKALSFAGRLQLVQSVIGSLHVFWASVFILPMRILLDIEQLMHGFLWGHGDTGRVKAKVAWDVVCLPKKERGLGIRRLDHFNKALMVSQIWKLLQKKESLWVTWLYMYQIKESFQFRHSPLSSHLKIAFKILRYLKSCPVLGIHIARTSGMFLNAYSDADWANKKQNTLSKSSTEAAYRALASVTSKVIWILNFLKELQIENLLPVSLHCDSNSTIKIAANPVFHERTKHLEIDLHFVRENFLKGVVKTVKVDSANQIVDILTKGLDTVHHMELVKRIEGLAVNEQRLKVEGLVLPSVDSFKSV